MALSLSLGACSTNPATGDRQFTALMPASSEAKVGAEEHAKVEQQFGKFMTGDIANIEEEVAGLDIHVMLKPVAPDDLRHMLGTLLSDANKTFA